MSPLVSATSVVRYSQTVSFDTTPTSSRGLVSTLFVLAAIVRREEVAL